MLDIFLSSKFKKDFKLVQKRNYNAEELETVVNILREEKTLPVKYKDHALHGDYEGFRECHILPDWLLIYQIKKDKLILLLVRTGSHSDLF